MNKISIIAHTVLTVVCLAACSEKTQTVEWYVEHPEILAKEVEKCKTKTLAELAADKHCTVIRQAQQKEFDDRQINAPIHKFK